MKTLFAALFALGLVGLATPAHAQYVTYYAPNYIPTTSYYAPTTTYYAPTAAYYAPAVTSYYAPTTAYYAPAVTSYYAPAVSYYAPAVTTSYYAAGGHVVLRSGVLWGLLLPDVLPARAVPPLVAIGKAPANSGWLWTKRNNFDDVAGTSGGMRRFVCRRVDALFWVLISATAPPAPDAVER